jgi:Ala-tRNA(Pro) deacylase
MATGQVVEYLRSRGAPYTVLTHQPAYTAQEEAAMAHVPGRFWAKTVVYFADSRPIMAVLPAHMIVDEPKLRALTGARLLRRATEDEMARLYPDCEVGAEPPFGPLYDQPVFVDETLRADPEVVFNAGTHADAIRMRYDDFSRLTTPTVGRFGRLAVSS